VTRVPEAVRRIGRQALVVLVPLVVISSFGMIPVLAAAPQTVAFPGSSSLTDGPNGASAATLLPSAARQAVTAAEGRATDIRAAVATGSFASITEALIAAGSQPVPAVPNLPSPSLAIRQRVSGLPIALRGPVAGLAAAVHRAREMFGSLSAKEVRHVRRAMRRFLDAAARHAVPSTIEPIGSHFPAPPSFGPNATRAQRMVAPASLLLAAALDRYLPELTAATAGDDSLTGQSAQGCDALDQSPFLCVGSDADNTYQRDEALLIDLGGNDLYHNSAGGAQLGVPDGVHADDAQYVVSLNIDLSGNDLYAPNEPKNPQWFEVAEGSANGPGVGYLIDLQGNDVYAGPEAGIGQVQGTGFAGAGALFDLGGNDRYEAFRTPVGKISAQAFATLGGFGGLIDVGRTDDSYSLTGEGGSVSTTISGQAEAFLGTAVLLDDGGQDSFLQSLTGSWSGPDVQDPQLEGQAFAIDGAAFLLEGQGDTTYSMVTKGEGSVSNRVFGQSVADLGATAVLDDLGGDDVYRLEASAVYEQDLQIDDSCGCSSALAAPPVTGPPGAPTTTGVGGQGWADFAATALLRDHLGNDHYSAIASYRFRAQLDDQRTDRQNPPTLVMQAADPTGRAQGWAAEAAVALLGDDSGNDSYELRSLNDVWGNVNSDQADGDPTVTRLEYPGAIEALEGQGRGSVSSTGPAIGALVDLGGSSDTFQAEHAWSPEGIASFRAEWPGVFGYGAGGVFAALGIDPQIVMNPSRPFVCGIPGYGAWTGSCSERPRANPIQDDPDHQAWDTGTPDTSIASAPLATGATPALSFTSETPTALVDDASDHCEYPNYRQWTDLPTAPNPSSLRSVEVGAKLLAPDGSPMQDALVHFGLGRSSTFSDQDDRWVTTWTVDARTGADGIARAQLPTWGTGCYTSSSLAVMATYDGGPHVYPKHALQSLGMSP
jgi:hypothetical protein